jgi:hypothetical protein
MSLADTFDQLLERGDFPITVHGMTADGFLRDALLPGRLQAEAAHMDLVQEVKIARTDGLFLLLVPLTFI